jgi:hypothetical protein
VPDTRRLSWLTSLALAAALVFLNASLTFENVWPTAKVAWGRTLSIELIVCLLLFAVIHRWTNRVTCHVLPAVWVALVLGRYVDVTGPGLYGRPFNLYWDAQHLGNVAAMMLRSVPAWKIALATAGAALVLLVTFLLSRLAWRQVATAMEHRPTRSVLGSAAAALILILTTQSMNVSSLTPRPFAASVTASYVKQARFMLATFGPQAAAPALGPSPNLDGGLDGLEGADVLLIFLESYGALTFDEPSIAGKLAASRDELVAAVRDSGNSVVSGYVTSPTFGGSSWLAHLSFLSGVEVRDQYAYSALMISTRDTLVTNFARRGYRTVALMPGMRQPWPEGAFYGFDVIYDRKELNYQGPQFGWWSIPDQYALAKLEALERRGGARAPLFAVFPTSTSHAPFGPVAPYQPDWSKMLTAHAYDGLDVERALAATPDLTNLRPSYIEAIAYEYRSLAGYVREHAGELVIIAVGDHQPPAAVSGRNAPWDVPVHLITNRRSIVDQLLASGFREGLGPERPPLGPMHMLLPTLLHAFENAPQTTQTAN